jgi:nicotinamide-nucleotide amidase
MPESNLSQAEFPTRAREISNPYGTATGIHYSMGGKEWFALPGVPAEMRRMMNDYVLVRLRESGFAGNVRVRVLRTASIGESNLMDRLNRLDDAARLVEIAFLPREYGVDVKLTARGAEEGILEDRLRQAENLLLPDLKDHLFGRDRETLPEAVGKLAKEKGVRIAVAESCTGGLISKLFTDIPGSSDYFDRGIVTYSNDSKTDLLGIPAEMIEEHGAVSEEVAAAMAQGMLQRSAADLTASVTGIAGPGGGTEEKPVGLVYIGIADEKRLEVRRFRFLFERDLNRKRTAMTVLKLLYDRIKNLDFYE